MYVSPDGFVSDLIKGQVMQCNWPIFKGVCIVPRKQSRLQQSALTSACEQSRIAKFLETPTIYDSEYEQTMSSTALQNCQLQRF